MKELAELFNSIGRETPLIGSRVKSVLLELSEHFVDMFMMIFGVVGEDQDIIKIDNDYNIKEVLEDVVHEMLKSCSCIG